MEIELLGETIKVSFWIPIIIWLVVLLGYSIMSFILYYHWSRYGWGSVVIKNAQLAYFILTPTILFLALVALIIAYV